MRKLPQNPALQRITYDNNGSLSTTQVAAGTTTNTYDHENRLTLITYSDSSATTFTYDGAGKRLSKVDSSGTIKYLYDMDKVMLERPAQDTTVASYTHEGGGLMYDLISMKRTNSYYYLFDGLGSVTEVVDSSENTQNSYRYEAFGQIKSSTQNVTNPYKYVGAFGVHHDPTAALYFMQARYYMATVGRFISMDPLLGGPQDPMSLHRYLYVGNRPVTHTDAAGLFPTWLCKQLCRLVPTPLARLSCQAACKAAETLDELRKIMDDVYGRRGKCVDPKHFGDCVGCPGPGHYFTQKCIPCCEALGYKYGDCSTICESIRHQKDKERNRACRQ